MIRAHLIAEDAEPWVGCVAEPNTNLPDPPSQCLRNYFEFLRICDGGVFGSVLLWSYENLLTNHFQLCYLPDEGADRYCIGTYCDDPLAIRKGSITVECWTRDQFGEGFDDFGPFLRFVNRDVLGPGYRNITPLPDDDDWLNVLVELRFA